MTITPNEILEKKFRSSFRGYDEDQVDEFLDAVKEEIENKIEENKLLCSQIMNLEEEISDLKLNKHSVDSADDTKQASEVIKNAKETADKYISDAKLTAEKIIIAANRKAEDSVDEASEKINELNSRVSMPQNDTSEVSNFQDSLATYLEEAKSQAFKILGEAKENAENLSNEARLHAENIVKNAEDKAKDLYENKMKSIDAEISEIKEKYNEEGMKKAMEQAEEKAKDTIEQAEEKAESIRNIMSIQISNSKQRLDDIQSAVTTYKNKFEDFISSQSKLFERIVQDDIEETGEGLNPDAISNIKDEIVKNSEEAGGLGLDLDKEYNNAATEEISNEQALKDDIKNSDYTPEESLSDEEKILKGMDDKYNEILNQINKLEEAKDEVKTMADDFNVNSVNPVVDLTDSTQEPDSVEKYVTMADEKTENVSISDDEKQNLKDMLDDVL